VIQRNAIRSWTLLHSDVEVILFGDEDGATEAARDLHVRQEAQVRRNAYGTPCLDFLFDRAQEIARHDVLCFLNCDILLMDDFREAVQRVAASRQRFLMVGRRWDTDLGESVDFAQPDWQQRLRARVLQHGRQRPAQWIDYFAFPRGLYQDQILPFAVGRPGYDNWLVWKTRALGVPVVDASSAVLAVHQNHDYSHLPQGQKGFWDGEETQRNYQLMGGWRHFHTIENAAYRLTPGGLRWNWRHWFVLGRRAAARAVSGVWFALLAITRPVRHALGLRQEKLAGSGTKQR